MREKAYVERKDVVKEIIHNVKRRKHTLILGETGIGKTSLLKHLHENYLQEHSVYSSIRPPKHLLKNVVKRIKPDYKKSSTKMELLQIIIREKPNIVLLLDDVELGTNLRTRLVKTLQRNGILVIGAGQYKRKKNNIRFDKEITLRALNKKEVKKLVHDLLSNEYDKENVTRVIMQETRRRPEMVKKICEEARVKHAHGEEHELREEVESTNKRVNILTTKNLINLGYFFITLRYIFYQQREYELGYLMSTIAYIIFFLFR